VDLPSVQENLTGVWDGSAGDGLDQGGLAGPVVADHRQHLTGEQIEADPVKTDHLAEGLDQTPGGQDGVLRVSEHGRTAQTDATGTADGGVGGFIVRDCHVRP